jgi:hypothetical protein
MIQTWLVGLATIFGVSVVITFLLEEAVRRMIFTFCFIAFPAAGFTYGAYALGAFIMGR